MTADSIEGVAVATREDLARIIREERITPLFQPIVDLFSGEVFGYEVFSRGEAPFENSRVMFEKAHEWELSFDLDCACRLRAFRVIAALGPEFLHKKFFINISPNIFAEHGFAKGFTLAKLKELGLDQRRIVLEISEAAPVADYDRFEEMIRHYFDQGFSISVDNFGAGHNGLVTLVAAAPNYVKLDYALVSEINTHVYKQHLVKSIRSFASNVESIVIAGGVETAAELETLVRLGVRFAQGYLLAKPCAQPGGVNPETEDTLRRFFEIFHYPHVTNENSIVGITMCPPILEPGRVTCAEMDRMFRKDTAIDHVIFARDGHPAGMLTRRHFYSAIGGPYGYEEHQGQYADELTTSSPLTVNERMELTSLGRLAMTRPRDEVYDPVLVVNSANKVLGTITMKQLLYKFINFEIRIAADSNPLTNLPGNRIIEKWISNALENPPFTIIYGDLDRFKEFNDAYGFAQGDRMIKLAARVLAEAFANPAGSQEVGHIGGDDFVVIQHTIVPEEQLAAVVRNFDELKKELFRPEDIERGHYRAEDRAGKQVDVPLVTLSLAIITSENVKGHFTLEQVSAVAASLKKRVKGINARTNHSGFLHERRTYD